MSNKGSSKILASFTTPPQRCISSEKQVKLAVSIMAYNFAQYTYNPSPISRQISTCLDSSYAQCDSNSIYYANQCQSMRYLVVYDQLSDNHQFSLCSG